MFVYSYARKLMYQKILGRYITLYMDTDSACLPLLEYDRINNDNGYELIENGEYGCLEEEVCVFKKCKSCVSRDIRCEELNNPQEEIDFRNNNIMVNGKRCDNCLFLPADKLIAISPKNYAVINSKSEKHTKRKFKGVRKTDYFLPLSYFASNEDKENGNKGYVKKTKEVGDKIVKYLEGSAVEKIRGNKNKDPMSQQEIRRMREFKCCNACVEKVINNKEKDMRCKECLDMSKLMCKAYSTEMFEYLVRGEKIAVFCSMINRVKFNVGKEIDWEFGEVSNYTPNIQELEHIFKSNNTNKEPINLKYNKEENTFTQQRKLESIFKLKQQYLIKII